MKLSKTQIIIGAFLAFWIIFIGWGMLKTGTKLFKAKKPPILMPSAPSETGEMKKTVEMTDIETQTPSPLKDGLNVIAEPESRTVLVRAFKIKPVNFQDVLPVMGSVKGKTEIELRFEINGTIERIYFREGENVKKGDVIASLDPKDAELRLAYATAKFNSAEAAYKSILKKLEIHKQLYGAGAIIKAKFEEVELESQSAKFQLETARNEMNLAENELKKTKIYATKDGVMGPREGEEGEFVTPQDKVGYLLEINEVYVEVGVVERDIEKIKIGQKAKVFVDAYPTITFEGTVDYIFPVIEGKSRTLTAKIKIANPDGLLLPGMFSRAEILIVDLKDALMVPSTSLVPAKGGIILIPVVPEQSLIKSEDESQTGMVQMRKVTLGYRTSDYAQIKSGANAGDLVIIEVQGGDIKDREKVKIISTEEMTF
ncbi:MAG: efflux RND transporter periplasmic adaptor subunit [Candidatus Omnitrophota bacterium]